MNEYHEGDEVEVLMPSGWMTGAVRRVLPNYASTGRTHYEITSDKIITIAPATVIRRKETRT